MKWKLPPSGMFLFLTLLHCALCNHHSHDKHGKRKTEHFLKNMNVTHHERPVSGIAISQLEDLSYLDPYNLIDGKSFKSKDKASLLQEIIPVWKSEHTLSKKSKERTKSKSLSFTHLKYSTRKNLKDPEKSTSLLPPPAFKNNLGRKLPSYVREKDFHQKITDSEEVDYYDMHDFGKIVEDEEKVKKSQSPSKRPLFTRIEQDRNALLHEAVRKLLGFSASLDFKQERGRLLPDPTKERRLPKYVKDLYERFQAGEMNTGLFNGNTVRSIHTSVGLVDGESMFLFNLSSLRPSEDLLSAEIHLYKRKLKPWVRSPDVEIVLYQVARHYISEVGKISIRDSASGWQLYDVTNGVISCLATRDPRPHMFGLSFRVQRFNGKIRALPLRKFGRHHSMPFLVVYTNETEPVNLDQLDLLADRLRVRISQEEKEIPDVPDAAFHAFVASDNVKSHLLPEEGSLSNAETDHDHVTGSVTENNLPTAKTGNNGVTRNSTEEENLSNSKLKPDHASHSTEEENLSNSKLKPYHASHSPEEENLSNSKLKPDLASHSVYSISGGVLDNSISIVIEPIATDKIEKSQVDPDVQVEQRQKRSIFTNEIPEDPADLEKEKNSHNFLKTYPGILKARQESRDQLGDPGLIPFPDHHLQRRRRRRKNRKHKHRKQLPIRGRKLRFPKEWEDFQESPVARKKLENMTTCGKRKLVVDFADIGWGDWIISPKSFEAHYCAGECPFPLTKQLRPSNHATIQSIVHAIGIYDKVPAPCCVPDVMSSVTLLYFDEDRNVVLKNYPGMTVEACACR